MNQKTFSTTFGITAAMVSVCSVDGYAKNKVERPNILFIVSEDNGKDIGCYDAPVHTPNLDALAASGTLFSQAYVPQAGSSPSRACFLTGTYPHENGQVGLATWLYSMYDENMPNIVNSLKDNGYRTGMLGKLHILPEESIHLDMWKKKSANFKRKKMDDYAEFAEDFINASDTPFYLQVNYPDAHDKWLPQVDGVPADPLTADEVDPIPFCGLDSPELRTATANYYNCMMRLDKYVGDLLDVLKRSGKYENTLIVYIGDHGAHILRGKITCYESGLGIPMIIAFPGKGRTENRYDGMVSTIDLYPTFMDVAGIPIPDHLDGKSLKDIVLKGKDRPLRKYMYGEFNVHSHHNPFPQRSVRDRRYKLIWNILPEGGSITGRYNVKHLMDPARFEQILSAAPDQVREAYDTMLNPPEYELYDLWADPNEWNNLSEDPKYDSIKKDLITRLRKWQIETGDPFIDKEVAKRFSDEIIATNLDRVEIGYHEYMKVDAVNR